jgi:hypothetical protein
MQHLDLFKMYLISWQSKIALRLASITYILFDNLEFALV